MLRVLHIVPALFSRDDGIIGGAERYVLELARNMARETPTALLTFGDRERRLTIDGLPIRVIGNPWYVRGQRSNPVSTALVGEVLKADVVHCHQRQVFASSLAAVTCRLSGRRVFITDLGGGGWDISAYISTDRWYHGHLHLSEFSRRLGATRSNVPGSVIFGGVDTCRFSPGDPCQRSDQVLFVGRILPHKGINYLIEGLSPARRLLIVGPIGDTCYLAELHRLAGSKQVTFCHDCSDEKLVNLYRQALCVVLPSVHRTMYGEEHPAPELLGQTLLEGMACGAPVICTNAGSMPEVVHDGITGFVVAPNDPDALGKKIEWLAAHPREAEIMGTAGRRHVMANFTWPQVVRRCLQSYAGQASLVRRESASSPSL